MGRVAGGGCWRPGDENGSAGVKYAFMLALLVAAVMLCIPGLSARMYDAFASLAGSRLASWLF